MAQNFRLSILPHNRQSYDVSQFVSESNTPLQDVGVIQNNMLSEPSSNGISQHSPQQVSSANNQLNGSSAKKYSIQEHPSKNFQKNPKDFWLCIGLMSIFTLIAIAGILIVEFGVLSKPREKYITITSFEVSNTTTTTITSTETDYDITTEIIVPSSIGQNETQILN